MKGNAECHGREKKKDRRDVGLEKSSLKCTKQWFLVIHHEKRQLIGRDWSTHHIACTETGLKMCCRPQTQTLNPPSPSRVMVVSASTRSTSPTVVFSLQSIPRRQHSSASWRPMQDTTTKYLVRPGWTLSSFTAWKQKKKSLKTKLFTQTLNTWRMQFVGGYFFCRTLATAFGIETRNHQRSFLNINYSVWP